MRYKTLGKSGLFVSEMCLGTMTFGQAGGQYAAASGVMQDEANKILKRAIEAGINFIDTANVYAGGQAEEVIGTAIKQLGISRDEIVIATKVGHAAGKHVNSSGATRFHLVNEVKKSLKRMGTDYIDLYQLHGWDPATPLEETMGALDELVKQGLVRYIGVSNWAAWQVSKALGISKHQQTTGFQCYQGYYSLVGTDMEREIIPMLESEGLGLLVYSPLAGGYLTGKYRDGQGEGRRKTIPFPPVDTVKSAPVLPVLDELASKYNVPVSAIALAWLLQQPQVTSVIVGIKRAEQLDDNLKAAEVTLSVEEMKRLSGITPLAIEYPGWMIANDTVARKKLMETGKPS